MEAQVQAPHGCISIHYKDKDTRALALQDTDEHQADRKTIYLLSW